MSNRIQLLRRKTIISAQGYGLEPKLANEFLALNVYMFRFITIKAIEIEPITPYNTYGRHSLLILPDSILAILRYRYSAQRVSSSFKGIILHHSYECDRGACGKANSYALAQDAGNAL